MPLQTTTFGQRVDSQPQTVLIVAERIGFLEREAQTFAEAMGFATVVLRLDRYELEGTDLAVEFPRKDPDATEPPPGYDEAMVATFGQLLDHVRPHALLAIGLDAGLALATRTTATFTTLVGPNDVDFTRSRIRFSERLKAVDSRTSAFLCTDILVQHSLVDKGSTKPHLLWRPYRYGPSNAAGAESQVDAVVAMVKSRQKHVALGSGERRAVRVGLRKAKRETLELLSYYRTSKQPPSPPVGDAAPFDERTADEHLSRGLATMTCVLLGNSNDHCAAAGYAVRAGAPLIIEDTAHNRLMARHLGVEVVPRERIVHELPELLDHTKGVTRAATPNPELGRIFHADQLAELPWFHEDIEFPADKTPSVVVLGSVSGFPTARDRARSVRVQSLLAALSERHGLVLIQAHRGLLERRRQLLAGLAEKGLLRFAYVESGTAPIDPELQDIFFDVLRELRRHGVPRGWFVRDAHFLDADFGYEESHRKALLAAAKSEAKLVADNAEVIFAPTAALFQRFVDAGLYPKEAQDRMVELPPGVDDESLPLAPSTTKGRKDPVTILYCGGAVAGVYRMPLYHKAVRRFLRSKRLRFVFISREDEIHELKRHYSRLQQRKIEFLAMRLEEYRSPTALTFGATFFEHPYGKATIPLKLFSYLGMGFPILAYDDCSYSKLVTDNEIGLTSQPSYEGLVKLFKTIEKQAELCFDLGTYAVANTWSKRAELLETSIKKAALLPMGHGAGRRRFPLVLPSIEKTSSPRLLEVSAPPSYYVPKVLMKEGLRGYEAETLATFLACLDEGPKGEFYDIGSNVGVFAWLAARLGDRKVTAFEPTPELANTIRDIALDNQLEITVEEIALSDEIGEATFFLSAKSDCSNSLRAGFRKAKDTLVVPVETVDAFVERRGHRPGVLKIDTETTEPAVLRGALETIAKLRPWMIIEVLAGTTEADLTRVLEPLEYQWFQITHEAQFVARREIFGDRAYKFTNWLFTPTPPPASFWTRKAAWLAALEACVPGSQ